MRSGLFLIIALIFARAALPAETAFGVTNIWKVEIEVSRERWNKLMSSRDLVPVLFRVNGERYGDVAIRQKGGGTTDGTRSGRPPLRVVFKGEKSPGVTNLSLNNNFFDKSYLRDVLSYKLCNDFGLAAPKTAFAKVYVRSTESERPRYLGLYTATEVVDKAFLRERFGVNAGLLMKPDLWRRGFGDSSKWSEHVPRLSPQTPGTRAEQDRVLAFMKLVREAPDEVFAREIASYIDVENFLRFIVVNVALVNLDSYLGMGKNYYWHLHPRTRKLSWIPWDFDLSFGGFFHAGTHQQRMRLSIDKPSSINDRLLERMLAIPEIKQRYRALLREFLDKHFQPAAIEHQIDVIAACIEPAVLEEGGERAAAFRKSLDGRGSGPRRRGRYIDVGLKEFVEGRVRSMEDQLAGRSKGERPDFGE